MSTQCSGQFIEILHKINGMACDSIFSLFNLESLLALNDRHKLHKLFGKKNIHKTMYIVL
jgi:hypothetical protein